jgi:pimeloyl-ACP methyl ester carboxylesterase
MAERMIDANGVELCTASFGDPTDPPLLLIMGRGASMLWWEDGFCRLLANGGRFVLRYDQRDTGRSVTYPHGRPGYTGADLLADAVGVLDAYAIEAAHVAGVSAGGGLAQLLALAHPDRILSLTLMSTSPGTPGKRALPGPTREFARFVENASLEWANRQSVIDYMVGYERMLAGDRRSFDEDARRELISRDVKRARDHAAIQNHDVLAEDDRDYPPLSAVSAPTLVIHGSADPMFPIEHGQALAFEIPKASLVRLEDAGHGLLGADWAPVTQAILEHTATSSGG